MDECEEDIYYFGPPKSVREYTCIPKENYQQMQSKLSELEAENAALKAEIEDMQITIDAYGETITAMNEFGLTQDAENKQLRAALEILTEPQRLQVCPGCHKSVVFDEIQRVWKRSHYDDCTIGIALGLSPKSGE